MPHPLKDQELASSGATMKFIEGRLTKLYKSTRDGCQRVYKGIEWRLDGLRTRIYSLTVCQLAYLYRPTLHRPIFIGITGSAGKTTTKDLLASILERHFPRGRRGDGTLNGPEDLARLVLSMRSSDSYCISEVAINNEAGIEQNSSIFRATVGVVTNIGSDHISAFGSLDAIAAEKCKLIKSLPASGIAVLNADDPRVLAMQSQCAGRTITYGINEHAMLRAEAIDAAWPSRLSFTITWKGKNARVQTQLCGSHWVPVVLAALATGVALGVPLEVAAAAVAEVKPYEGRMSPVELGDGVTFMRDDWKAPLWTISPTFEFMRQAKAVRKIIVIGTISDFSGSATKCYVKIARQALALADCVLFVGPRSSACLRAKGDANDPLFAFPSPRNAATFLQGYLRSGDLVLLKGSSRADHLERLILDRTSSVACWRVACGRFHFCEECSLVHVVSDPDPIEIDSKIALSNQESLPKRGTATDAPPTEIVIGLGNPGEQYIHTPHNVGHCVVDILAQRLNCEWTRVGDSAMVARTQWDDHSICLIKPLTFINESGPTILQLSHTLGFNIKDCLVVHDDLDLPLGTIRSRQRGSDGGHRGVQSIIQSFQDDKFRRVKIGIGKPTSETTVVDYVLTPFGPAQRAAVDAGNLIAADRVLYLIRQSSMSKTALPLENSA